MILAGVGARFVVPAPPVVAGGAAAAGVEPDLLGFADLAAPGSPCPQAERSNATQKKKIVPKALIVSAPVEGKAVELNKL